MREKDKEARDRMREKSIDKARDKIWKRERERDH